MTVFFDIFWSFTQHENSASRSLVGVSRRSAWQFWDVSTRIAGFSTPLIAECGCVKAAGTPKILWHLWYPIVYRCLESSVQFSHYRFLFLLDNREDFSSAMTVPKEVPIRAVMSWPVEALMAVGQVWISARWVVCRKF